MDLKQIVKSIEQEAVGGKEFFDILDDELGSHYWCSRIYKLVKDPFRYTFICSGTFGKMFVDFLRASENR